MSRGKTVSPSALANTLAAAIVPRGRKRHTPLSRVLLRTSGAARPWLPAGLRDAIEQRFLSVWLNDRHGIALEQGKPPRDPDWPTAPDRLGSTELHSLPGEGLILLGDAAATPLPGGAAHLATTLSATSDAMIAYGDELHTGPDGMVCGQWLQLMM